MMLKKNDMDISSKISLYRNDDVLQYYDWNGVKGVLKFNLKHLANNPFNREWLSTLVDVRVDVDGNILDLRTWRNKSLDSVLVSDKLRLQNLSRVVLQPEESVGRNLHTENEAQACPPSQVVLTVHTSIPRVECHLFNRRRNGHWHP